MPSIRETHRLPYTAEQMFDLVADVDKYPEFLPWVVATRVRRDSDTEMTADMLVGFKALREKFTSKVVKDRPNSINVHYIDGPLRDLDNNWTFRSCGENCCEIDFAVDFSFKNIMFETLAALRAVLRSARVALEYPSTATFISGSEVMRAPTK